jgi:hypothetical protein
MIPCPERHRAQDSEEHTYNEHVKLQQERSCAQTQAAEKIAELEVVSYVSPTTQSYMFYAFYP